MFFSQVFVFKYFYGNTLFYALANIDPADGLCIEHAGAVVAIARPLI
jgi:hypothetical protein